MSQDLDPCTQCGACCASLRVSFDRSQLLSAGGRVPDGLADDETEATCRLQGTDRNPPRCAALIGAVGVAVKCAIYADRPDPCRDFSPDGLAGILNDECTRARRRHGLAPLVYPPARRL